MADERLVAAIRDAARESGLAGARLTDAVVAARDAGMSWERIGDAVGITRQSAHERWKLAAARTADADGATTATCDWRPLIDGTRLESHAMPTADAVMLGRHVKAALGHLVVAQDLAEQAGIDLAVVIRGAPGYELCELFRTAADAVEELDGWAINNCRANGGDRSSYAGTERWCWRGGTLPATTPASGTGKELHGRTSS